MKKILFLIILLSWNVIGQSGSFLRQKCTSPYNSIYSTVQITSVGNINYIPCPTRSSIFSGIVNFSGATVIGLPFTASPLTTKGDIWGYNTGNARIPVGTNGQVLTADSTNALGVAWTTPSSGGVTGSGTINFIPRFTVTGSVIGNTPFSWSGSQYVWNNTALNAAFRMELTPFVGGSGLFRVGDFTGVNPFIQVAENTGRTDFNAFNSANVSMRLDNTAGTYDVKIGNLGRNTISLQSALFAVNSSNLILLNNDATGDTQIGDIFGAGNSTTIDVNDNTQAISLIAKGAINVNSGVGTTKIGDVNNVGGSTLLTVDDSSNSITANADLFATTITSGQLTPNAAGSVAIGSTAIPFQNVFLGNAAGNSVQLVGTFTANRVATFPDATGTVQLIGAANTGTVMAVQFANSTLANATGTIFTSPCTSLALTGTTEGNVSCPVTRSGTVRNLFVRTGGTAKVNTPTTTITMRKNGSNQPVTLVMTDTINTTTSDTMHSFTVTQGDLITISISVAGAAAVSTSIAGITFEID